MSEQKAKSEETKDNNEGKISEIVYFLAPNIFIKTILI